MTPEELRRLRASAQSNYDRSGLRVASRPLPLNVMGATVDNLIIKKEPNITQSEADQNSGIV